MSSYVGISPKNPSKYLGPNVYTLSIVTRNREPTGADVRLPSTGAYYPIGSFWVISKNPTTGVEGDLWYLSKIVANVAYWIEFNTSPSPAGLTWEQVTGTTQQIDVEHSYVPFNGSLTTFTLPAAAVFGEEFQIEGYGAGGWTIAQNAGQSIIMGTDTSTIGVGGSISSTAANDTLRVVCLVANTLFKAVYWTGNPTVV